MMSQPFQTQMVPRLNPWFSIWRRPRAVIQQVIDTNPRYGVSFLAVCYGIWLFLIRAGQLDIADRVDDLLVIILTAVLGGGLGGLVQLYIWGALLRWTGAWIGGKASVEQVRAAFAWGNVSSVANIALWFPQLIINGRGMFSQNPSAAYASPLLNCMMLIVIVLQLILTGWGAVILFKCLGQVQSFSAWKAMANILLASLILGIVVGVPVLGYLLIQKG